MQQTASPTEVQIKDGLQSVILSWDDGHESTYPWWYLRGFCPCATCQGHGNETHYIENDAPQLTTVNEVGNYALNMVWDGNHATGIYAFDYLRRICPCAPCRKSAGQEHVAALLPAGQKAKF